MRGGLDPALFWELSPREAQAISRGAVARIRDAHNERAWQAWQTAMLPHQKQPPRYADMLLRDPAEMRVTRGNDWERQFAAFSAWVSAAGK